MTSYLNAIKFYEKLGFTQEGRHKDKIKNTDNSLETPIGMTWFNPNYKSACYIETSSE